ncbi:MAG TPA: hypothetical protein VN802_13045, partial [Stellaceae bacterium]|nr:hypothetical protein [Stellaceae bacterium]
ADAINTGNGGQVAVWSDGVTTFDGSITAKGGALGGNGGYVETSGHTLDFASGSVNASAAHGAAGTWLLDPFSLTFNRAEADALASALDLNNVAVMTASDGATAGFGIVNANGNGDITFNFSVNWNSANTLFLSAYGNINIGAGVTLAGGEGSAVLMQQNTGNTNLLFNGSFEQLLPGGTVPSSTNIPGWTQSGNPGDTDVLTAEAGEGYTPEDGSYYLFVGPVGSDGVQSQSFVDRPGDSLVVSGFLAGNGSGISDFSMSFNGTPVVTVPNPVPLQPYVFYSAAVTATGNDTFSVSYRNDPSFDAIDNFTVCRASATCVNTGPVIPGAEGGGILTPAQQFQQNQTMQGANTVGQQVVNGIGNPPILLPLPPLPQFAGLPEPSFAIDLNAGVGAGAGGLGSVIGLDTGGDTYGQISGGGSTSDNPFFDIPPVTLAPHPFPLPQQSDQPLGGPGSNLFQELTVDVRRNGLYDGPPLNRGNDALWFRTGGGT